MPLPDVTFTILDGQLGALNPDTGQVQLVIGCSDSGTALVPTQVNSPTDLVTLFGHGPLVSACAVAMADGLAPLVVCKVASNTPGTAGAVTHVGTGLSVMTVTGSPPNDTYDIIAKVTRAGQIGTGPAPGFILSQDGGVTYGPEVRAQTGAPPFVYIVPNSGGMSLTFSDVGPTDFVVDDTYSFKTVEPKWLAADVATAIGLAGAAPNEFGFIHVVGPCNATQAGTIKTAVDSLATSKIFESCLLSARDIDFVGAESESTWITSIETDFASFESSRIGVIAGFGRQSNILDRWVLRRPMAWKAAGRGSAVPLHNSLGRVKDGSLPGMGKDNAGTSIYHDERGVPGLDAQRFITARTHLGIPGIYFTAAPLMAAAGSDFGQWQMRRVIDLACRTARNFFVQNINDSVRLDEVTGFILERDARDLELRSNAALRDALVSPGHASAVTTTVSRTDNISSTSTITVNIRMLPLGYTRFISVTIGFTNPALFGGG
jgi:hypothetical protein